MRYFLSRESILRRLETPSVYQIKKDDLYELDEDSFAFLNRCASEGGCDTEDSEFADYCLEEGILTKEKVKVRSGRPVPAKSPKPSLRYLELQITSKCNLRCGHCYIGSGRAATPSPRDRSGRPSVRGIEKDELSVRQIRNVLREFEEMQGLRVLISGGEPLIHSKFGEINEMLPDFSLRKVLFTNGLLLNNEILRRLNVEEIQVSIDGLEGGHEALRGKGSFKPALDAVRRAIDSGFEVSVATMVHPMNLGEFEGMKQMFIDVGIKDWTVDVPCITGHLERHAQFRISPEEGGKYLAYGYGAGLHTGASGFACGLHLMAVMADGSVSKCTFYAASPVGRIEDGLRKSWKRIKTVKLDALACDCRYIESCRGGCRYRALLFGNPLGKDLYRCAFYDILEESSKHEG